MKKSHVIKGLDVSHAVINKLSIVEMGLGHEDVGVE